MKKFLILTSLLVFVCPVESFANDSEAAVEAGNLVLKKSDGITMESEELYLSLDQVRVHYVFKNTTPKEIRTIVAFPIGKYTYETGPDGSVFQDPELTANLHFKVTVQGKVVATKMERKIEKRGEYYLDKATYYWDQIFPAGAKLEVTHTYQPQVGGFFYYPKQDEYHSVKEYCIDADLQARLKKTTAATTLHYVLTTGANWKGPIKNFKMTLDKGKPKTLVSLCLDGLRKISPTQFEVVKKNFKPKQDLQIVFFESN